MDTPVAWWGFDEGAGDTIDDISGNDLHANLDGGAWISGCAP